MKSIIAATAIALLAVPPDPATLFANGDFTAAAEAARSTLAHSPSDSGALLVAGTVALYENDLATARADLRRIATRSANVLEIARLLAEVRHRESIASHRDISFGQNRDVTKFVATQPLPVIPVTVDGHRAFFQIDTGAPGIALDRDFAASLALPGAPAHHGIFADGKVVNIPQIRVATLGIGSASVRNLSADVLPLRRTLGAGVGRIDGVLGTGVLERFAAFTLDYPRRQLVTYAPSATIAVDAEATVPFYVVGDHFLATRSVIAGVDGISIIDSGLIGGGIVPSAAVVNAAHLALTDGGEFMTPSGARRRVSRVVVPEVRIGAAVERNIAGFYSPGPSPGHLFPFAINGTISHGFFDHRALTFDFTRMRLSIGF